MTAGIESGMTIIWCSTGDEQRNFVRLERVIQGFVGEYASLEDDAFRNSNPVKLFFKETCYMVIQTAKNHMGRYVQNLSNMIEMLMNSWGELFLLHCDVPLLCFHCFCCFLLWKLSPNAVADYNRARTYLADLANRDRVPVFNNVSEAVSCAVQRFSSEYTNHLGSPTW